MIYWFFGFPGIGKDYCAKRLAVIEKFSYLDADDFLTDEDREKLLNKKFTRQDRLLKLERIIDHIKKLQKHHDNIALGDSLPDNTSREYVLSAFSGQIKLILVTAPSIVHKKRISQRKNHFFGENLLDDYMKKWEEVSVSHIAFENNSSRNLDERLKELR